MWFKQNTRTLFLGQTVQQLPTHGADSDAANADAADVVQEPN